MPPVSLWPHQEVNLERKGSFCRRTGDFGAEELLVPGAGPRQEGWKDVASWVVVMKGQRCQVAPAAHTVLEPRVAGPEGLWEGVWGGPAPLRAHVDRCACSAL